MPGGSLRVFSRVCGGGAARTAVAQTTAAFRAAEQQAIGPGPSICSTSSTRVERVYSDTHVEMLTIATLPPTSDSLGHLGPIFMVARNRPSIAVNALGSLMDSVTDPSSVGGALGLAKSAADTVARCDPSDAPVWNEAISDLRGSLIKVEKLLPKSDKSFQNACEQALKKAEADDRRSSAAAFAVVTAFVASWFAACIKWL